MSSQYSDWDFSRHPVTDAWPVKMPCITASHLSDVLGEDELPKAFYSVRPPLISEWNCSSSALDTVWSSRRSHWLITVHWKTAPWPAGCSTSERGTLCVSIVSPQLWTLWAFAVPEMAWTLTGKGDGLMDFSCSSLGEGCPLLSMSWTADQCVDYRGTTWGVKTVSEENLPALAIAESRAQSHCGTWALYQRRVGEFGNGGSDQAPKWPKTQRSKAVFRRPRVRVSWDDD